MMLGRVLVLACVAAAAKPLRDDGVEVARLPADHIRRATAGDGESYPFTPFPEELVARALAVAVDLRGSPAVTSVKDQGPHGYCGTFGRVASAEGQYGARSGFGARNLSVEQLIDCVGWDLDQTAGAFLSTGLMAEEDYPYNLTAYPDADPPVPGNPCRFDAGRVVPGSVFSNHTAVPVRYGEDAFAAGVYAWGPLQVGVNADVFGERDDDGFVTAAGCAKHDGEDIDHSVTLVGYGTDAAKRDFWIIKNSWGAAFADGGYVYMARGVNCASILEADAGLYTVGPPASYYPWA